VKRNGSAQLPLLIGMLVLSILIPATVKLVEERQELRRQATEASPVLEDFTCDFARRWHYSCNTDGTGVLCDCDCTQDDEEHCNCYNRRYNNCTCQDICGQAGFMVAPAGMSFGCSHHKCGCNQNLCPPGALSSTHFFVITF